MQGERGLPVTTSEKFGGMNVLDSNQRFHSSQFE